MNAVKIVLAIVLLAVAIYFGAGQLLPDRVHMERRITVNASPEQVFALVNTPGQYIYWSPWFAKDPHIQLEFSGPNTGKGAKVSWWSSIKSVGTGSETIIESRENRFVRTLLDFGAQTASATFTLDATAQGTRVSWGLDGDLDGSLTGRFIGLFVDYLAGPEYEIGLANIKRLAEQRS